MLNFAEKHMVGDNVTNEEKRENSTSIGVSKEEIKEANASLEKLMNSINVLERKLKILVDVLANEPMYNKAELSIVANACMGLAAKEVEIMINSVEGEIAKLPTNDKQNEQAEKSAAIRK